jgi:hypothetical protein
MCRVEFEAKRRDAKYCGERCRKRAQRVPRDAEALKARKPRAKRSSGSKLPREPRGKAAAAQGAAVSPEAGQPAEGAGKVRREGLVARSEQALEAAGRLETPEGQAVMVLAARIEISAFSADTGSSVAALVRQFHLSLDRALGRGGAAAGDPVEDELKAARDRRARIAAR